MRISNTAKIPGEILRIHKHAIWEIPEGVKYEEAVVLDPICNAHTAVAQQSHLIPGQDVVVFGTGPLGLFSVQIARLMGAKHCYGEGLNKDVDTVSSRFVAELHVVNGSKEDVAKRCTEICEETIQIS